MEKQQLFLKEKMTLDKDVLETKDIFLGNNYEWHVKKYF